MKIIYNLLLSRFTVSTHFNVDKVLLPSAQK